MFDTHAARRGAATAISLAWRDPLQAFRRFAGQPGISFLYSSGEAGARSRYSYLCIEPAALLRCERGRVTVDGRAVAGDAFSALRALLGDMRAVTATGTVPVPFGGGAVGFFGYDTATGLENTPRAPRGFADMPDAQFAIYTVLFAWDHEAGRAWLLAPEDAPAAMLDRALARWHGPPPPAEKPAALHWRETLSAAAHQARVARALAYIEAGDIYQANITAPFVAERPPQATAASLFAALAAANPAPFSAYIDCGGGRAVASVSPERFIRLSPAGEIETRPIKGTRKRGATVAEDRAAAEDLLGSAKDRAENLMIVDLMRNDLSRVAVAGSVRVPALNMLESFASVHHLVSCVQAQLRPGLDAIDLLRAAFPGGSITGAPKIRAMQIIADLEGTARGPYCGAAAWLGFDGAMDSSVLIRTVTITPRYVLAQAGGGIVADSDPVAEWDELLVKIMPMLRALGTT